MNTQAIWTFGHKVNPNTYIGSTQTEGLGIGQKVSNEVETQVDIADSVTITDMDQTKGLGVTLNKLPSGNFLTVTNRSGEFETATRIPVEVHDSEIERVGGNLNPNPNFQNVEKVTVDEFNGATYISLKDQQYMGERGIVIEDGKLEYLLRQA